MAGPVPPVGAAAAVAARMRPRSARRGIAALHFGGTLVKEVRDGFFPGRHVAVDARRIFVAVILVLVILVPHRIDVRPDGQHVLVDLDVIFILAVDGRPRPILRAVLDGRRLAGPTPTTTAAAATPPELSGARIVATLFASIGILVARLLVTRLLARRTLRRFRLVVCAKIRWRIGRCGARRFVSRARPASSPASSGAARAGLFAGVA
jgi:hypothetical protein